MAYYPDWYVFFIIFSITCGVTAWIFLMLTDPHSLCVSFFDYSLWILILLILLPILLAFFLKERKNCTSSVSPPDLDLSLSLTSFVVPERKRDVFISFNGTDTRSGFLSHLYKALSQKKIDTFVDYKLEKGNEISPALAAAIEESEISLIIFSEGYVSSKGCLEELTKIIECMENHKQIVIPIFYNIEPSSVRHQRGSYEDAFDQHEKGKRCKNDLFKLQKCRNALEKAANLSGFHSSNHKTEAELIEKVVECVLMRLNQTRNQSALKGLVGIRERVEHLEALLCTKSQDVLIIGIWGMGGIGKSTIAEVVFDRLSNEYEGSDFLRVREELEKHGLTLLKDKLLSKLLEEDLHIVMHNGIPSYVKRRLSRKKVLVVLDDINDPKQLKILTGGHEWFGPGSKIIMTSRDMHVFTRECDVIYEVKSLKFEEALQLFNLNAFGEVSLEKEKEFHQLSMMVINYAKGIPLVLKVLGSFLYDKTEDEWKSELKKLENIPCPEIQDILKLSYDGLDDEQKDIFLFLACFFGAESREQIAFLLDACDYHTTIGLRVLQDKALINICSEGIVSMHELIQEMGQEIVCKISRKDPRKRNHLWDPNDIEKVLKTNTGTRVIESICLDTSKLKRDLYLRPQAFDGMDNLKFLKFRHWKEHGCKVHPPNEGLKSLPNELRYLYWSSYPSKSLPLQFHVDNLVELSMQNSSLQRLWDGIQDLPSLKNIDLSYSEELFDIPDLSRAPNLERLYLYNCYSLHHLPVLTNQKLVQLYLNDCQELRSLGHISKQEQPNEVFNGLESLEILTMSSCYNITQLPYNIGHLPSLRYLILSKCDVKTLPESIKHLSQLRGLYIMECRRLESLPGLPPSIEKLFAWECTSLETLFFDLNSMPLSRPKYELIFSFGNCVKLNDDAIEALVKHYQLRIRKILEASDWNSYARLYFPKNKVSACFSNYGTRHGSVSINLGQAMHCTVMGFLFYFAMEPIKGILCKLKIKCYVEESNGGEVQYVSPAPYSSFDNVSDHVYLWYDGSLGLKMMEQFSRCKGSSLDYCPKVSFEISIDPLECLPKVKEWGPCPIYVL